MTPPIMAVIFCIGCLISMAYSTAPRPSCLAQRLINIICKAIRTWVLLVASSSSSRARRTSSGDIQRIDS